MYDQSQGWVVSMFEVCRTRYEATPRTTGKRCRRHHPADGMNVCNSLMLVDMHTTKLGVMFWLHELTWMWHMEWINKAKPTCGSHDLGYGLTRHLYSSNKVGFSEAPVCDKCRHPGAEGFVVYRRGEEAAAGTKEWTMRTWPSSVTSSRRRSMTWRRPWLSSNHRSFCATNGCRGCTSCTGGCGRCSNTAQVGPRWRQAAANGLFQDRLQPARVQWATDQVVDGTSEGCTCRGASVQSQGGRRNRPGIEHCYTSDLHDQITNMCLCIHSSLNLTGRVPSCRLPHRLGRMKSVCDAGCFGKYIVCFARIDIRCMIRHVCIEAQLLQT